MNFNEWWNDQKNGAPVMVFNTDEEMARAAWNAAKEECAQICMEQQIYLRTRQLIAAAIRSKS